MCVSISRMKRAEKEAAGFLFLRLRALFVALPSRWIVWIFQPLQLSSHLFSRRFWMPAARGIKRPKRRNALLSTRTHQANALFLFAAFCFPILQPTLAKSSWKKRMKRASLLLLLLFFVIFLVSFFLYFFFFFELTIGENRRFETFAVLIRLWEDFSSAEEDIWRNSTLSSRCCLFFVLLVEEGIMFSIFHNS